MPAAVVEMAEKDKAACKALAKKIMGGEMTVEEMNDELDMLTDQEYEMVGAQCRTMNAGMNALRESGYRRNAKKRGETAVPYGGAIDAPVSFAGALVGVELMTTGTHNTKSHGEVTITEKDLAEIVKATSKTIGMTKPPIKLGHENKLGDSEPRLGTLTKVYLKGKKILGDFVGVANTLMSAVKDGRYTRVSVEMHPTLRYLSAVAFLGTAMPAVKNLADIVKLSDGSDGEEPVEWEIAFALSDGAPPAEPAENGGEKDMPNDPTKEVMPAGSGNGQVDPQKFAALEAKVTEMEATNKALRTDVRNTKITAAIERLRAVRRLAPADDGLFILAAEKCSVEDSVKFTGTDGKETVGTSLDQLVAVFMARPEQWKAGEVAAGENAEKPTDATKGADPLFPDESLEDARKFAEKIGQAAIFEEKKS